VLDLSGDEVVLLRPGGATIEAIEAVIGPVRRAQSSDALRSPGMLVSHYAPTLPLRLEAQHVQSDEALLAFGTPLAGAARVFNLSEGSDLNEAAARLFTGLRTLDAAGVKRIAVMPIPDRGLGRAINDRLRRAAAPRT
jgi:L-threonylcarbamoyladenylate synthase